MKRHRVGSARIVPIYVRPCDWHELEVADLQTLPSRNKALTRWSDKDFAWTTVAKGIRATIADLLKTPAQHVPGSRSIYREADLAAAPRLSTDDNGVGEPFASFSDMATVRSSYRLLNVYQRDLFKVVRQVFAASVKQFGTFKVVGWGSNLFDLPVRRDKNPLDKWVYDYLPLGHANFWWASEKRPHAGGLSLSVWHCSDSAVEEARERFPEIEPTPSMLRANGESDSTLRFYVRSTVRMDPQVPIRDWGYVDSFVETSPDFQMSSWEDEKVHETSAAGLIRYGGFARRVQQLRTREDVQEQIVRPLMALAGAACGP